MRNGTLSSAFGVVLFGLVAIGCSSPAGSAGSPNVQNNDITSLDVTRQADTSSPDGSSSDGAMVDSTGRQTDSENSAAKQPNILVIILDDYGWDASPCHDVAKTVAKAPNIKKLCDTGVIFDNTWSAPTCSPTRAAILTGRHGFRNGIGAQLTSNKHPGLSLTEITLPMAIEKGLPGVYANACIGKWHLGGTSNGLLNSPNKLGFSHYSGLIQGAVQNYFSWQRVVNGVKQQSKVWVPTQNVNDAIDWLKSGQSQNKPFFLWVAFNAPHSPFHVPPADLHTAEGLSQQPPKNPIAHYQAMIEATDTEIGRLLSQVGEDKLANTYIIFLGDNGTPNAVVQDPITKGRAKGSLYQGGIRVPMAISGPMVTQPGRTDAMVHVLDLFATILELVDVDPKVVVPDDRIVDSISLVPYLADPMRSSLRTLLMSELFDSPTDSDGKAIRNATHKLIRYDEGGTELFDLSQDPWEGNDLWAKPGSRSAEAIAQHKSLSDALDGLLATKSN